jgi:DNA-binding NarL/FixJ family response regulator
VIRIIVVDDHPALRAGLDTVLAAEPGMVPVGSAASASELWPVLKTCQPDIVLLDYHLPGEDGLQVCRRIKARLLAPKVLLYSAYAGSELSIPATLAGADGVIGKGIPARELYDAIRRVAGGYRVVPPISPQLMQDARERVGEDDLPLLGMLLHQTPVPDIAPVLNIDATTVERRIDSMIGRLRVEVPEVDP